MYVCAMLINGTEAADGSALAAGALVGDKTQAATARRFSSCSACRPHDDDDDDDARRAHIIVVSCDRLMATLGLLAAEAAG